MDELAGIKDLGQDLTVSVKLSIEVVAGLIPGTPEPEFTRQWHWTSADQERLNGDDPDQKERARRKWISIAGESREYAASLENPARVNWVRREWLWW